MTRVIGGNICVLSMLNLRKGSPVRKRAIEYAARDPKANAKRLATVDTKMLFKKYC